MACRTVTEPSRSSEPSTSPTRTTVPAGVVSCSTSTSPAMVWPSSDSRTLVPTTRTNGLLPRVSTATVIEPPVPVTRLTPGAESATAACSVPLTPSGARTRSAVPVWVTVAAAVPPPRESTRCWPTRCTTLRPAASVVRVMVRSPCSVWPRTARSRPVPDTETYGPPGSVSVVGLPATRKVVSTFAPVVLTCSRSVPPTETFGTTTLTVPLTWPASPVGVSSISRLPLRRVRTPPTSTPTFAAATRTSGVPVSETTRSTAKSPVIRWPSTVSTRPVASKRR